MAQYVWIYKDLHSFKVWGYDLYQNQSEHTGQVIYYWGPAGKPMNQLQKKEHNGNYWEMVDEVRDKIDEKEREGYKRVPNMVYFDAVYDFIETLQQQMEVTR